MEVEVRAEDLEVVVRVEERVRWASQADTGSRSKSNSSVGRVMFVVS